MSTFITEWWTYSCIIEILGRDPGLSIYLYNATSEISSITLKPKDELNKVEVGEYIIGERLLQESTTFLLTQPRWARIL